MFHSDLPTIKTPLTLHTVRHHDMTLLQRRQVLTIPNSSTVMGQDFHSHASMTAAVLKLIPKADDKNISTEQPCHIEGCVLPSPLTSSSYISRVDVQHLLPTFSILIFKLRIKVAAQCELVDADTSTERALGRLGSHLGIFLKRWHSVGLVAGSAACRPYPLYTTIEWQRSRQFLDPKRILSSFQDNFGAFGS